MSVYISIYEIPVSGSVIMPGCMQGTMREMMPDVSLMYNRDWDAHRMARRILQKGLTIYFLPPHRYSIYGSCVRSVFSCGYPP